MVADCSRQDRTVSSHSSGGQKPKVKVLAGRGEERAGGGGSSGSEGEPLSWLLVATSLQSLHPSFSGLLPCVSASDKDTSHTGFRAHPMSTTSS